MAEYFVPFIHRSDESFSRESSENYRLTLQLSTSGLYYCLMDISLSRYIHLEAYHSGETDSEGRISQLLGWIGEHPLLTKPFGQVTVLYEPQASTLVPSAFLDESSLALHADFNFRYPAGSVIRHDSMSHLEASLIYPAPADLMEGLERIYPGMSFRCHSSVLIDGIILACKSATPQKRVFAHVRSQRVDLMILEGSKLIFFNTFRFTTREDLTYFLAYSLEQLKMTPGSSHLTLLGLIDKDSGLFEMIRQYFPDPGFIGYPEGFGYSRIFTDIPAHYFYNLLIAPLCVS
ncbi:MAG: DUF3822 family protein [Bacteroidales bacterium]|nr:DUF3822 family protein [Bacteroidales bacterium]